MSLKIRKPTVPELADEGWEVWEDTDDLMPVEFHWIHAPSIRAITIVEARERATCTDHAGTEHRSGWFVICRQHDENGNPFEGTMLGPFGTMAEGIRRGRVMRRSILDDSKVDVSIAEQGTLFAEISS